MLGRAGPRFEPPGLAAPGVSADLLATLAAGALGTWLGLHALRAYLMMVVWNVAEDAPATRMGMVAAGVWLVGLLGWVPARLLGGSRPALRLGALLAALAVARQALPGEVLSPVLAFSGAVAWLWWLPAFWQEAAQRGAAGWLAPAALVGLAGQVAGQAALHGLDLHVLAGPWSVLGGAALAGTFLAALSRAGREPAPNLSVSKPGPGWGPLAFFPFLFLQMTLLANLGRLEQLSGWGLPATALLVEASLLGGLAALLAAPGRLPRLGLGALALVLVAFGLELRGWLVLAIVPAQVGVALLLDAAFAPRTSPRGGRVYALAAAGAIALFALLFLFYARDVWPPLWPAAGLLLLAAAGGPGAGSTGDSRPLAAAAALAAAGLGLSLIPAGPAAPAPGPAPAELAVLDYNIHQGLDTWSVPALPAIADLIEASGADLVALQEVNRGWNISGGVDAVAYLRWRLPQYHLVYGPMHSDLFGNAILSRYPIRDWGWERYPLGPSGLPRGYVWATVPTQAGEALFVSTHLTPYQRLGEEDRERLEQAELLLGFWGGRARAILAGDFNNEPDSPAIRRLLAGSLRDALAERGLGQASTYRADRPYQRIDYVFTSPDVDAIAAEIPGVAASDHLPLLVRLRLGSL